MADKNKYVDKPEQGEKRQQYFPVGFVKQIPGKTQL
jgi:hypothetical protein